MSDQRVAYNKIKKGIYPAFTPLGKLLVRLKIHPETFTIGGGIASMGVLYFYATRSLFLAGIAIIITELCDILDGQLARYAHSSTRFGAFIDATTDRYGEGLIYLGLLMYFWQQSLLVALFVLIAFFGSFLVSYTRARAESEGFECVYGFMKRKVRMALLSATTIIAAFVPEGEAILGISIIVLALLCHFTAFQRILYVHA